MARRQYFSAGLMQKIDPKAEVRKIKSIPKITISALFTRGRFRACGRSVGRRWDDKWGRDVKFIGGDGREWTATSASRCSPLLRLHPHHRHLELASHLPNPRTGTVRGARLLSSHPEFQLDPKLDPADRINRHFRYCDFFAQAGWYDESEHELDRLLDEKPPDDVKAKSRRPAPP